MGLSFLTKPGTWAISNPKTKRWMMVSNVPVAGKGPADRREKEIQQRKGGWHG